MTKDDSDGEDQRWRVEELCRRESRGAGEEGGGSWKAVVGLEDASELGEVLFISEGEDEIRQRTAVVVVVTILNIGRCIGISSEIPVFYSKWYGKCNILSDIILNWYGPIYHHVADIWADIWDKNFNLSPRDAFEEILKRFYRHIWGTSTKEYPHEFMTLSLL